MNSFITSHADDVTAGRIAVEIRHYGLVVQGASREDGLFLSPHGVPFRVNDSTQEVVHGYDGKRVNGVLHANYGAPNGFTYAAGTKFEYDLEKHDGEMSKTRGTPVSEEYPFLIGSDQYAVKESDSKRFYLETSLKKGIEVFFKRSVLTPNILQMGIVTTTKGILC